MNSIWMLAAGEPAAENTEVITMEQAEQKTTSTTASNGDSSATETTPTPKQQQNPAFFYLMLGVLAIFFVMTFMSPRKRQKEHQKMVSSLKKNDRVRTIGGIYGTVLEVRQDDIVLKIDENNNTKIHVIPSAIGTVLAEEKK